MKQWWWSYIHTLLLTHWYNFISILYLCMYLLFFCKIIYFVLLVNPPIIQSIKLPINQILIDAFCQASSSQWGLSGKQDGPGAHPCRDDGAEGSAVAVRQKLWQEHIGKHWRKVSFIRKESWILSNYTAFFTWPIYIMYGSSRFSDIKHSWDKANLLWTISFKKTYRPIKRIILQTTIPSLGLS